MSNWQCPHLLVKKHVIVKSNCCYSHELHSEAPEAFQKASPDKILRSVIVLATRRRSRGGMCSLFTGCLPFSFMSACPRSTQQRPAQTPSKQRHVVFFPADKRAVEIQMFGHV